MLTSFFVRFFAEISEKEFEELKKTAIRAVNVLNQDEHGREDRWLLIGKHWTVIASKLEEIKYWSTRVILPCEPKTEYQRCIEYPKDDDSVWLLGFENCVDVELDEVQYSITANEAYVRFKCIDVEYEALFNIVIDPQHAEELDETILKLIAKYFGARDLPAMFRPM